LAPATASRTSNQFRFLPNHHRIAMARQQRAPNSRYLRVVGFKGISKPLDLEEHEPQDIGPLAKATTVQYS
jgi:hypothetical protein